MFSLYDSNNPRQTLNQEAEWLSTELGKIGYNVEQVKEGLKRLRSDDNRIYESYFDYSDLFSMLFPKYTYEITNKVQGINSEKNINTFKVLYIGYSRKYTRHNFKDEYYHSDDNICNFYNTVIQEYMMSLGNRKSDELYKLLSNRRVISILINFISISNYAYIYNTLEKSISIGDYEIADFILSNVYEVSNKYTLDYFSVLYESIIDNLKFINMDETSKELLLKWAEYSNISDRAKIVINSKNKKLSKEEKINRIVEETNALMNNIINNSQRLSNCLRELNKIDSKTAYQIMKNIFVNNSNIALNDCNTANALLNIASVIPLIDDFDLIKESLDIINKNAGNNEIPYYKINASFSLYLSRLYEDCLKKKQLSILDYVENGILNLNDNKKNKKEHVEIVDGISMEISSNFDDISIKDETITMITYNLQRENDNYSIERIKNLIKKTNSERINNIYNEIEERKKMDNDSVYIKTKFVEAVTKKRLDNIDDAYYKLLSKVRCGSISNEDIKTIIRIVILNNVFENLPSGNSIDIPIMFFQIIDATHDFELIEILFNDSLIINSVKQKIVNYNMYIEKDNYYEEQEKIICDRYVYNGASKLLFSFNLNDNYYELLKSIIECIKDLDTRKKISELFDIYRLLKNGSETELESINDIIVNKIINSEITNIYPDFLSKMSNENYKIIAHFLRKYIDKKNEDELYDYNNIMKVGFIINHFAEKNGYDFFINLLEFDQTLKKYYFEECTDMYHIMDLRASISIDTFLDIIKLIINNVSDKKNFIMKCLSSINYRKTITPFEIDFFENEINKIENNESLLRKIELLKKKVSE